MATDQELATTPFSPHAAAAARRLVEREAGRASPVLAIATVSERQIVACCMRRRSPAFALAGAGLMRLATVADEPMRRRPIALLGEQAVVQIGGRDVVLQRPTGTRAKLLAQALVEHPGTTEADRVDQLVEIAGIVLPDMAEHIEAEATLPELRRIAAAAIELAGFSSAR